jgi:hypothetical protein
MIKVTLCMKTKWKDGFLKFFISRVLSNIGENMFSLGKQRSFIIRE